jgi:hypothetical protein
MSLLNPGKCFMEGRGFNHSCCGVLISEFPRV